MIPSAPIFREITLLLKDNEGKPSIKIDHKDSAMIITGNYVIITEEKKVSIDEPATIKGEVYEMKDIHSYKLLKN